MPFNCASEKYTGSDLTEEVKDLDKENYKNTSKRNEIRHEEMEPHFLLMDWKVHIFKMVIVNE